MSSWPQSDQLLVELPMLHCPFAINTATDDDAANRLPLWLLLLMLR